MTQRPISPAPAPAPASIEAPTSAPAARAIPATVCLIAAVARRGVIGRDNRLIWHLPQDLQHFKRATLGHPIVMGRKTFESIGKALPGRRNIVITRQNGWQAQGAETAASLPAALALAGAVPRVCVIGGAQIYEQALPLADEVLLTEIDADFQGDAHFPMARMADFVETARETHRSDQGWDYAFVTYRRPSTTRPPA